VVVFMRIDYPGTRRHNPAWLTAGETGYPR
jgi:hypothetical protein